MISPTPSSFSIVRPTLDTPFHIDFEWWKEYEHDWHVHLEKCLCAEHQALFAAGSVNQFIDWIHPETAEVSRVDAIQHTLIEHCAKQPDFVTSKTMMTEAVFRIFLANGNSPLTPNELEPLTGKPAMTILKTLAGHKVYMGIRPAQE